MKPVIAAFLVALLAAVMAPPAAADGHGEVTAGPNAYEGSTPGGSGGSRRDPAASRGTNGARGRPAANDAPVYDVGLSETADGQGGTTPCWRIEVGGRQTLEQAQDMLGRFDNNGTLHDACPRGQRGPTLAERVQAQFERWSPSATTAEIAPGYVLTGLKGFLVIDDPTPASITLVGQTVSLSKEYRIRWGDGSSTTTTSTGVPYPGGDGEITHIYTDAGNVTVEIDLVVTGSWNGRNLGSLAPVTTTLPLEVWQVQAVRRR